MRRPRQIFEDLLSGEPLTQESVEWCIKIVQIEAWNEAIDTAANKAEIKSYYKSNNKHSRFKEWKEGENIDPFNTTQMYKVDKKSIKSLKIK